MDTEFIADSPPVVLADNGKATYAWVRGGDVQYRTRTAGGALSAVATAFTADSNSAGNAVRLGVDGAGRVTIAWQKITQLAGSNERCQIQTARLAANGTLGAVRAVSAVMSGASCACIGGPACTGSFNAAVNTGGDAVFTWTQAGTILTRALSAGGTLSAAQTVATTESISGNHLTAISPNGGVTYAWVDTSFDASVSHVLRIRERTAAGVLRAPKTVVTSAGGANPPTPQFDVDAADGASTIVYSRANGSDLDSPVTVFSRLLSAGTLSPASTLSTPSVSYPRASSPTVSIDAAGGVSLAWIRSGASLGDSRLQTRTRPSATGSLTPIQGVAGNGDDQIEAFRLDRVAGASIFAWSGFITEPPDFQFGQFARVRRANGTFTVPQNYAQNFVG